jgi:DNA-binding beta-propeller fold protein YncE
MARIEPDRGTVALGSTGAPARPRRRAVAAAVGLTVGALLALPSAAAAAPDAYVTNTGANTISHYTIGPDGALTGQPSPTATGTNPEGIAVSPDGKSAYVANSFDGAGDNDGTISQYDIAADGSLTPKDPATVPAGDGPLWIAVSPDGAHAYVVNFADDNVSQYSIDGTTGELTAKTPATVNAGDVPQGIAVSPNGQYVYVANTTSPTIAGTISQYNVGADGSLSAMSTATVAAGFDPQKIVVSPDGDSAYATDSSLSQVLQYDISGTTGALSAKDPAAASTGPGSFPFGITVSPNGTSVYNANAAVDTVAQFSADGTTGELSSKTPATAPAGDNPIGIAVSPDGQSVYVTNAEDQDISQYDVGADGTLTAKSPATVDAGLTPRGIAIRPDTIGPTTTITAGPSGTVNQSGASFGFTASESGSTFRCRLDGGAFASCSSPKSYSGLADGSYTFQVRATDFSRNTGPAATRTWAIDTGPDDTTPLPDAAAPRLLLGGPASQELGRTVKVKASCDELCQVDAGGKVVVRSGDAGGKALLRAAKKLRVGLKSASADLAAGEQKTLKLKLSKKKLKKAQRAMRAEGAKAKAKLSVTATDTADNGVTEKRTVKLRD